MRTRRALLLGLVVAVCTNVAAGSATTGAVRVCTKGQTTSKAKPCAAGKTAVATESATVALIRLLDPRRGLYQLEVTSPTAGRWIKSVSWSPPLSLQITAITSTEGGHCNLVNNAIGCTGGNKRMPPPKCACRGSLTINFTMSGPVPSDLQPPSTPGIHFPVPVPADAHVQICNAPCD